MAPHHQEAGYFDPFHTIDRALPPEVTDSRMNRSAKIVVTVVTPRREERRGHAGLRSPRPVR
jgi:hypothetical protein